MQMAGVSYQDYTNLPAYLETDAHAGLSASQAVAKLIKLALDLGLRLASEPTSAVILCAALGDEVSRMPPQQCKKAYDITKQKVTEACLKARGSGVVLPWVSELPADPIGLDEAIIQHAFGGIAPVKNEAALTDCLHLIRFVPMRATDRRLRQDDRCNNAMMPMMMPSSGTSSSSSGMQVPGPMMAMMNQMMVMQQQLLQALGTNVSGQQQDLKLTILGPKASSAPPPAAGALTRRLIQRLGSVEGPATDSAAASRPAISDGATADAGSDAADDATLDTAPQPPPPAVPALPVKPAAASPEGKGQNPLDAVARMLAAGAQAKGQATPKPAAKSKGRAMKRAKGKAKAKASAMKVSAKAKAADKARAKAAGFGCSKCAYREKGCFRSCYIARGSSLLDYLTVYQVWSSY